MTPIIIIILILLAAAIGIYCFDKRIVVIDLEEKEKEEKEKEKKKVYRVNLRSKEIHRLDSPHSQCNLDLIKNYRDIPEDELGFYLGNGFNGCRYCAKEVDTDIYNKKSNETEKNI